VCLAGFSSWWIDVETSRHTIVIPLQLTFVPGLAPEFNRNLAVVRNNL